MAGAPPRGTDAGHGRVGYPRRELLNSHCLRVSRNQDSFHPVEKKSAHLAGVPFQNLGQIL